MCSSDLACFIWNYFNTNPDKKQVIEGDIVILDLDGMRHTVEFASVKDVQVAQDRKSVV